MGIYIIDLIALLFAIGVGFGLSCWILGTLLENSNSFGDNKGRFSKIPTASVTTKVTNATTKPMPNFPQEKTGLTIPSAIISATHTERISAKTAMVLLTQSP